MAKQFWVKTGDNTAGPFTSKQLRQFALMGALKPDSQLSQDERRWVAASTVKGLEFRDANAPAQKQRPSTSKEPPSDDSGYELAAEPDDDLPAPGAALPSSPSTNAESTGGRKAGARVKSVEVKSSMFGGVMRYEIATSEFGSPVLHKQRYRGDRPTGKKETINLVFYDSAIVTEGSTLGPYLAQLLVVIVIFVLGLGICGLFIIMGLGISPNWSRPNVTFHAADEENPFNCPSFDFPDSDSLHQFVSMLKSSTKIRVRKI